MKRIIVFILIVASFEPVFCIENLKNDKSIIQLKETSKNSLKIGYYVFIKRCGVVADFKTQSLIDAEKFIHSFYHEFCENLEYQFQFTPYYRVLAYEKEIYIEKMQITRSGKYKRIKKFMKFGQ